MIDTRELGKYLLIAGAAWGAWYLWREYGSKWLNSTNYSNTNTNTNSNTNNNSNLNTNTNSNDNTNSNTTSQSEYYLTLQQVIAIEQAHPDWQGKVLENTKYKDYQVGFYYNKELMDWGDISKDTFNTLVERGYKVLQYVSED